MSVEYQNPEDVFWSLIESDPSNPTHRLIFADWCDENDKPIMGDVQRSLAATGREPFRTENKLWVWTNGAFVEPLPSNLPQNLFRHLENLPNLLNVQSKTAGVAFHHYREAEEALVPAWIAATRKRWLYRSWRPKFPKVPGAKTNLVRSSISIRPESFATTFYYVFFALYSFIAVVLLIAILLMS